MLTPVSRWTTADRLWSPYRTPPPQTVVACELVFNPNGRGVQVVVERVSARVHRGSGQRRVQEPPGPVPRVARCRGTDGNGGESGVADARSLPGGRQFLRPADYVCDDLRPQRTGGAAADCDDAAQ